MSKSREDARVELIYQPQPNASTFSPELRPGQVITVSESEAQRLLEGGQFIKPSTPKPAPIEAETPPAGKKGGK
jgi:hypothetical protein